VNRSNYEGIIIRITKQAIQVKGFGGPNSESIKVIPKALDE
jgi:hypothetical protein